MGEFVLVIGGSLMDTKGKPSAGLEPGTSNPAFIRSTYGGTGRNIAENLGRLGAEVVLLSAVGEDDIGRQLIDSTSVAGVNVDQVRIIPHARSGQYIAVLDAAGHLSVALDDTSVMSNVSPTYLHQQRHLFEEAAMVVIDGSLSNEALSTAIGLASECDVPLCADPSSTDSPPVYVHFYIK